MSKQRTELIATAAVAEQLGLSTRQIHRLVDAEKLTPAFKIPGLRGAYLFTADEVERLQRERAGQVPA